MIRFTFLSENKTDNPGCMAEHGLSIYLEAGGKKLLFDTGASLLFRANAEFMNVDLSQVDACIISHGHYDHTQGVPSFCKINHSAPIFIHKDAFGETYGMEGDTLDEEPCGILWTAKERREVGRRLTRTDGVMLLTEDIVISGTIPDVEGYPPTEKFFVRLIDGTLTDDPMNHEQFLIVRDRDEQGDSKGLFLFSGCSHKGIVPVLRYAKTLFPGEPIAGFVAGMHLYNADVDMRRQAVEQLEQEGVGLIMPVHCTGIHGICELKAALGERCIVATAGDSYQF